MRLGVIDIGSNTVHLLVVDVELTHVLGHADGVDAAVAIPTEGVLGLGEEALAVLPAGAVARPGSAAHLAGDVGGEVGVEVDGHHVGPHGGEGVAGLASDALAGAEDDVALAVEPQAAGVVGDLGVVGARHGSG